MDRLGLPRPPLRRRRASDAAPTLGRVPVTVLWLRRDLRLADSPALLAAVAGAGGDGVLPLFVLDPALLGPAGPTRTAWLFRSLAAWSASTGGALVVRSGDPAQVVPAVAAEVGADAVHVTADAGPHGRLRDEAVEAALAADGRALVRTGTPYAIGPGTLLTGGATPFAVYSAFDRAWVAHGHPDPAPAPADDVWLRGPASEDLPPEPDLGGLVLPPAGEAAALARWAEFTERIGSYDTDRDRPDRDGTSQLSVHLKYGEVHPRTLLAALPGLVAAGVRPEGVETFRKELVWREFYADVLWNRPETAREYYRPQLEAMQYADPSGPGEAAEQLAAWEEGRTGFPFVDAGLRQMRAEGWMHNRVRMVVASFLVKDLHQDWRVGARVFMRWLRDGDLASNNHGWQWVAGSGTDAAPYFRIFNPVTQGQKFDPDGDYVRRYVPELAHLAGRAVHEPWKAADGYAHGYPQRIVDHATERAESLARYAAVRG